MYSCPLPQVVRQIIDRADRVENNHDRQKHQVECRIHKFPQHTVYRTIGGRISKKDGATSDPIFQRYTVHSSSTAYMRDATPYFATSRTCFFHSKLTVHDSIALCSYLLYRLTATDRCRQDEVFPSMRCPSCCWPNYIGTDETAWVVRCFGSNEE